MGYQTKETSHGQFCSLVATFVPTGTDGSTMKLGDIKPANTTWDGSTLFFLNQYGGTDKFDHEAYGNVKKQFYYLNAEEADEFKCAEGWYHVSDEMSEYPMNDLTVPYGQAFMFDAKDAGATLMFSGQVKNGARISTIHGQFNFTGNVTPVALTLGDFTCENTTWDGSTLFFLNQYGGTDKFDHEAYGNVKKQFYYLNTTEADDFDCDPGWYHVTDELSEYPMNSVINIPAGAGFMIDAKDAGATLIVPAVLSQN